MVVGGKSTAEQNPTVMVVGREPPATKQKPAVRLNETAGSAILKNRIKASIEEILSEG
jgi:hypothetical protein